MTVKLERHISVGKIVWALFAMMVLTIFMWIFWLAFSHLYQSLTPASSWVEYYSVEPVKTWFLLWEKIEMVSISKRHQDIDMQRQDTLFCDHDNYTIKYATQYRPPEWYEYKMKWDIRWWREYSLDIPEYETQCKICWIAIAITPLWYKKTSTYCSEYFSVNL